MYIFLILESKENFQLQRVGISSATIADKS